MKMKIEQLSPVNDSLQELFASMKETEREMQQVMGIPKDLESDVTNHLLEASSYFLGHWTFRPKPIKLEKGAFPFRLPGK